MEPERFVDLVQAHIIQDNRGFYREVFNVRADDPVRDEYWKRALELFGALSPIQQSALFEIIDQVMQDTVSNVLGAIDGTSYFGEKTGELKLLLDGKQISGDLQSLFLGRNVSDRTGI